MRCLSCGALAPLIPAFDQLSCLTCGKRTVWPTAEEYIRNPDLGVVPSIRPMQVAYTKLIEETIHAHARRCALIEAPCGLGKSFGYGLAAILSPHRVIIATGNKSLQDQLSTKDMPYLMKKVDRPPRPMPDLLPDPAEQHDGDPLFDVLSKHARRQKEHEEAFATYTVCLQKGRSNYFCYRNHSAAEPIYRQHFKHQLWKELKEWGRDNPYYGDKDMYPNPLDKVADHSMLDECRTNACKHYEKCGYRALKRDASRADILVVNTYLLGFDLRYGPGTVLKPYDVLIVDEAHTCPDALRLAFTDEFRRSQLKRIKYMLHTNGLTIPSFNTSEQWKKIEEVWEYLFDNIKKDIDKDIKTLQPKYMNRGLCAFGRMLNKLTNELIEAIHNAYGQYTEAWTADGQLYKPLTDEAAYYAPPPVQNTLFNLLRDNLDNSLRPLLEDKTHPRYSKLAQLFSDAMENLKILNKLNAIRTFLKGTETALENYVDSYEADATGKIHNVKRQPIQLAPLIKDKWTRISKTIFTSATIERTALITELGLQVTTLCDYPPAYDFKTNALFYLPTHIPTPNSQGHLSALAHEIVELMRASKGCGLVLFTSKVALKQTYEYIEQNYTLDNTPIIAQSDQWTAAQVKALFHATDNSTIFGLRSFVEGFDVPGDRLRLVIVTKIPFLAPKDPLVYAKCNTLPAPMYWDHFYNPHARNQLRQAFGRLIRSTTDWGVAAMLDTRFWSNGSNSPNPADIIDGAKDWMEIQANWEKISKSRYKQYGYKMFKTLPFSNCTTSILDVKVFLKNHLR